MTMRQLSRNWNIAIAFFICRLIFIISTPLDGIKSYGDFVHFYHLAQMGVPFIDYWVEFPPVFPFLSWLIYQISGEQEHVYDYLLLILLSLFQAGGLVIFSKLAAKIKPNIESWIGIGVYFIINLILPYTWWYFDVLAVTTLLLGISWFFEAKDIRSAVILAIGALIKLFPALALCLIWRYRPGKRAFLLSFILVLIVTGSYLLLYLVSPSFTKASIISQSRKGSWETIWALLDNNYRTGNFGPEIERLDAEAAGNAIGNPARISPWITIMFFLLIGSYFYKQLNGDQPIVQIGLLCIAFLIFFNWMPGWSPQWILYLIPLVLLIFDDMEGVIISGILALVNLLEWPVLLSRGYPWSLWLTVPIRTIFFGFLIYIIFLRVRNISIKCVNHIDQANLENQ